MLNNLYKLQNNFSFANNITLLRWNCPLTTNKSFCGKHIVDHILASPFGISMTVVSHLYPFPVDKSNIHLCIHLHLQKQRLNVCTYIYTHITFTLLFILSCKQNSAGHFARNHFHHIHNDPE